VPGHNSACYQMSDSFVSVIRGIFHQLNSGEI
jgi:hypothetical protein